MTDPAVRTRVQICIDCADADGVVWFQPVPETKVVKNRLHLDMWFDAEGGAVLRRDELVAVGATAVRREVDFWLMHDPEGNEFCLCWP